MDKAIKPVWESLVFRGIASILFGIAAVFWPGLTIVALVYIFSIYILVSGVISIVQAIMDIAHKRSWFLTLLIGIAELAVGVYLVRNPVVSFATLILLIGLVLIARGVFEVVVAITEEPSATYKMLMTVGGALSVLVGIIILLQPEAGGVAFVWILGLYALVTGPIWIALGLDVKRIAESRGKR